MQLKNIYKISATYAVTPCIHTIKLYLIKWSNANFMLLKELPVLQGYSRNRCSSGSIKNETKVGLASFDSKSDTTCGTSKIGSNVYL